MEDAMVGDPSKVFREFSVAGSDFLERIRNEVAHPARGKRLRHWGIVEASKLIGRSAQRIREAEAQDERFTQPPLGPVAKDPAGNRVYTLDRINAYRNLFGTRPTRPPGSRPVRCPVVNFKGGAGKTTTAVHLAQKCALDGYRVLMVDMDPQASTTLFFGLIADVDVTAEQTISDALVNNPSAIRECIQPTYFPGIHLIASSLYLQDAELQLSNPRLNNVDKLNLRAVDRLDVAISTIEDDYDVVVIDCGPNLGILSLNAVRAASGLLIPIQPAMADFGSVVLFFNSMAELFGDERLLRSLEFLKVCITRHTGTNEAKTTEAMIRVAFRNYVMQPVMVQSVEIERCFNDFGTVYESERLRGSREAYQRAVLALDAINDEMISTFRSVWQRQVVAAA
jgi:chromosome partitioning protein